MSWITIICLLTSGVCLALAGVHLLVWFLQRDAWPDLLLSIAAMFAAARAFSEELLMHAQSAAQFGETLRWAHLMTAVIVVSLVWFIRLRLHAGRLWLAWLICAVRALALVINFAQQPNLNFREISDLGRVSFLGEMVSVPIGVVSPWANLGQLSMVLLLAYVLDASISAWKQGSRRRAAMIGGTISFAIVIAAVLSGLALYRDLPGPFVSPVFLVIVLVMASDLSHSLVLTSQLSRELRSAQERMSLAAAAADLSIWDWDIARDKIRISAPWARLAGDESESLDFNRYLRLVHPDDREQIQRSMRRALDSDSGLEAETRVIAPDGSTRWISARGRLERGPTGKPLHLRGISIDITERKQTELEAEELRQNLTHLQRASTASLLASTLAHELNHPLGAILLDTKAAELLLAQHNPSGLEELRTILASIGRHTERAGAVIDRMRSLLKRQAPTPVLLSLKELLDEVTSLVRVEVQARRTELEVDLPSDLPPIFADRIHLEQVFLNLIMNGLNAMEKSPWARRLAVRVRKGSDKVEIAVHDNGSGIPVDKLPNIFEPFWTTKGEGLGVGLAISKMIIESHGGRIWAENNPDGGATFRFTVKVARDDGQGRTSERLRIQPSPTALGMLREEAIDNGQ